MATPPTINAQTNIVYTIKDAIAELNVEPEYAVAVLKRHDVHKKGNKIHASPSEMAVIKRYLKKNPNSNGERLYTVQDGMREFQLGRARVSLLFKQYNVWKIDNKYLATKEEFERIRNRPNQTMKFSALAQGS